LQFDWIETGTTVHAPVDTVLDRGARRARVGIHRNPEPRCERDKWLQSGHERHTNAGRKRKYEVDWRRESRRGAASEGKVDARLESGAARLIVELNLLTLLVADRHLKLSVERDARRRAAANVQRRLELERGAQSRLQLDRKRKRRNHNSRQTRNKLVGQFESRRRHADLAASGRGDLELRIEAQRSAHENEVQVRVRAPHTVFQVNFELESDLCANFSDHGNFDVDAFLLKLECLR
jgi:hypothetical protein